MLLSIDRVLQLLAEGKTLTKIAELAKCSEHDVSYVIEQARKIINKHEKQLARKKIIIEKDPLNNKQFQNDQQDGIDAAKLFLGAELSAVPIESSLTIYVSGKSLGNPGPSGIGIVINDRDNRQVGKLSLYIGKSTKIATQYSAIIKAMKIAEYFDTKTLKVRTDSELFLKQIESNSEINQKRIKKLRDEVLSLKKKFNSCKFELVMGYINEKANYLADMAISTAKMSK